MSHNFSCSPQGGKLSQLICCIANCKTIVGGIYNMQISTKYTRTLVGLSTKGSIRGQSKTQYY